jgi:hypothetical protein
MDGFVAKTCVVCEEPLLVSADNPRASYHVHCAKIAKRMAEAGSAYDRV